MPILGVVASSISGNLGNPAYDSIATQTASGSSTTITFTSIPSTFKHLELRAIARDGRSLSVDGFWPRFNNDTSGNYNSNMLAAGGAFNTFGYGGGPTYPIQPSIGIAGTASASYFGNTIMRIMDYTSSKWKPFVAISTARTTESSGYGEIALGGGWWQSTSAINRIDVTNESNTNFVAGTVFALYGIKG